MLPSLWNLCPKWPTPFEKRWLWPISAYNISSIGDSEESSIITNIKLTTGFSTSFRCSAYITPKSGKGGSKSNFFVFLYKSQLNQMKSATKFFCLKSSSGKAVVQPFPYLMVLNLKFSSKWPTPLKLPIAFHR